MKPKPPDQKTKANQDAWNTGRYAAWEAAFGGAQAEAQRIKSDPEHILRRIAPFDLPHKFDALVLELGILHYHRDLEKFFSVMRTLSDTGGTLFLNEFHPVQRKLFWPSGPQNYFSNEIIKADVPNPDQAGASLGECQYRFWTMGEVLNAVIKSGFRITRLDEHLDWDDNTIPGTFTLIAQA